MTNAIYQAVTVTLNPAIDQTVTIPNFTAGAVNRVQEIRSNPGGKGVNVASALADYGHSVAATGFLGRENAIVFEELFERKDIADHFVRIAGQTRLGIKISDPERGETTDINFPGPAPEPENLKGLSQQIDELAALDHSWFVLAGSVPPGIDSGIYRELASTLRQRGQRVVLDTSGEPFRQALEAAPNIIKPNIHELEALVGFTLPDRESIVKVARDLVGRGIEMVAVSMGADGALFVTDQLVVSARPPRISVRSTVGAGDAMVAGIVAGMIRECSLADCARLATAFSIVALTRGGSRINTGGAIDATMQEVTVE